LQQEHLDKLSLFCNVPKDCVIVEKDVETSIYEIPLVLSRAGLDEIILNRFRIVKPSKPLTDWEALIETIKNPQGTVRIGVVGKYSELQDAYKSIYEALYHGGYAAGYEVDIVKMSAEDIEKDPSILDTVDGVLIPGGFGSRGMEGKIRAAQYARENKIPFLGICLGLQCAVIEFARNVCGLAGAHTTEFDEERGIKTEHPVVCLMEEQMDVEEKGGTMRLGACPCILEENTKAFDAYGTKNVSERHRHRYEVNNNYCEQLKEKGLVLSGTNPDIGVVEMIELPDHPWFVATQAHPELKSQPVNPHPLFKDFVAAAVKKAEG
ncbi:MAG: CTP synthase, partial [Verrucomicrobia bacterium]|nr:CTP synthase [Verrucomicrobiota bacterium]